MEYRKLGNTGLLVSELCLGTMTFGIWTEEDEAHRLLDQYTDAGGNFIDTANVYSEGISEQFLGRWLARRERHSVVVATKAYFQMGEGPNDGGLSRVNLLRSVEESLRRLQTDYIDLYQVHCWDDLTPIEETLGAMESLVASGKVRYIGASNHTGWQLQRAVDTSEREGFARYVSLQPLYNLLDRTIEWDLIPVCVNEGLGIIPWSPLRGGWLTGKYRRGMSAPPADTRVHAATKGGWPEQWANYNTERTWRIVDALVGVASELGREPAQVALNWVKDRRGVTAPIVGARNTKQLQTNLASVGWKLPQEQRDRLTEASEPPRFYPHDFVEQAQSARRGFVAPVGADASR